MEERKVWWCAIAARDGYATYEELKGRKVVAQGWPKLGDLSKLFRQSEGEIRRAITQKFKLAGSPMKPSELRVFVNLLTKIHPGDLVIGIEGTNVKGICKILPSAKYRYDKRHEYSHSLGQVAWYDWKEVSSQWKPYIQRAPLGIVHLKKDAKRILNQWARFTNIRTPFKPRLVSAAQQKEEREQVKKDIMQRRGQARFRQALLEAYRKRCAISGWNAVDALEAAHIRTYKGEDDNHVTNGILLRADLHTLFDLRLIKLRTTDWTVHIDRKLRGTPYQSFNGKRLKNLPRDERLRPKKVSNIITGSVSTGT